MHKVKILDSTSITQETITSSVLLRNIDLFSVQAISSNIILNTDTADADTGTYEITTITFDTKVNTGAGDYVVLYDTTGAAWAVAADATGSSAAPTGAIWAAIPAANKAQADISGATTAADVAAAFELAFDGITGFTSVITSDDTAADGTMTMTHLVPADATDAVVKSADDSGAGSIAVAESTKGVAGDVDISADSFTLTAHGYATGLKIALTTDDTLPTGLSATDYFLVVVDANTVKFATSLVNANAGTVVNITAYGAGTHTVTPKTLSSASVIVQASNDNSNWDDVGSAVNITEAGNEVINVSDAGYKYARAKFAITEGQFDSYVLFVGKESKIR